jgi:hypothetical protein
MRTAADRQKAAIGKKEIGLAKSHAGTAIEWAYKNLTRLFVFCFRKNGI